MAFSKIIMPRSHLHSLHPVPGEGGDSNSKSLGSSNVINKNTHTHPLNIWIRGSYSIEDCQLMNVKEDIKAVTCFGQMSPMDIQPTAVKDTQSQSTTDYFLITIGKGISIMKKSNRPGLDHMIKLNMTNNETLASFVSHWDKIFLPQ